MLKKININSNIKMLAAHSIIMYTVSRALILILFNAVLDHLNSGRVSAASLLENRPQYFLCYLAVDIIPLLLTAPLAISTAKKILTEFYRKNSMDMESIASDRQRELEKQSKIINNLSSLYNDAVEYNRLKTEFFSNISHELKTPLSVILGAIQLIDQNNPVANPEKRNSSKHFKIIKQNCYRLVRLINNILDITRIDSGYIKLNLVNCNIVCLVEEIAQSIAPYAEQKGLTLEFDTEYEEIITAVDIDKIERIMLNLLSNAIKFTPSGGKISVAVNGADEKVLISVKDTGPGIHASMRSMIFERFKQVSNSFTREFEGTGIGLSLVKSFVDLHDGNITIDSEEGRGSEFIIEIPVKVSEENSCSAPLTQKNQSKIIEAINIEFSDIYSAAS